MIAGTSDSSSLAPPALLPLSHGIAAMFFLTIFTSLVRALVAHLSTPRAPAYTHVSIARHDPAIRKATLQSKINAAEAKLEAAEAKFDKICEVRNAAFAKTFPGDMVFNDMEKFMSDMTALEEMKPSRDDAHEARDAITQARLELAELRGRMLERISSEVLKID